MLYDWNYSHNTTNLNSQLLCISGNNITYMENLLHTYYQNIREEKCATTTATAYATATTSVPIASGPVFTTTCDTDTTLSDTPADPYKWISKLPSEIPMEEF